MSDDSAPQIFIVEDRSGPRYLISDQSAPRYSVVDQSSARYVVADQSTVRYVVLDQSQPRFIFQVTPETDGTGDTGWSSRDEMWSDKNWHWDGSYKA